MIKLRDILFENKSSHLIDEWKQSISPLELKMYCIRDNCGPAALDFKSFAEKKGMKLNRIEGFFKADKAASQKNDFTLEMKQEFLNDGGDFNNATEREEWVENSKYSDQWKFIPHYWLKDNNGVIYDPVGKEQFIDTGYSKDLNSSRYKLSDINNVVIPSRI